LECSGTHNDLNSQASSGSDGENKDKAQAITDSRRPIKKELIPHSLALGPDDMFCWISDSTVRSNGLFKKTFPRIQRTLEHEQQRSRLRTLVSLIVTTIL
jgi:hypothetical protein